MCLARLNFNNTLLISKKGFKRNISGYCKSNIIIMIDVELHPDGIAFKNPILRKWVQFRVGAIPSEPIIIDFLYCFVES